MIVFSTVLACLISIAASCLPDLPTEEAQEADVPLKIKTETSDGPSFAQDIQPILHQYCISCHGAERAENDLRLDSYENVMKGSKSGAVVIPGWPEASPLVYVIRRPPSQEISMPYHAKKLTPNRIKNVMSWIEAGALDN